MKRYLIFAAILGLAGVLAFFAVGTITGPASAHVEGLTVDPKGAVLQPGGSQVSISGTLTCTAGETGSINVQVIQFVRGQVVASAFASAPPFPCSGVVQDWAVTALAFIPFKPGPANVRVDVFTFGLDGFDFRQTSATVKLQPARELPPVSPPVSPPASPPSSALAAALSGPAGVATMGVFTSILMVGAAAGFLRLLDTGGRRETE